MAGRLAMCSSPGEEEIRLGPRSRVEVAEQIAVQAAGYARRLVDGLSVRAEGSPFFTE